MNKEKTNKVLDYFEELFPDAHCELNHQNVFELLVAVMLSAQTTDKKVNQVTASLFKKYPTVESFALASLEDLQDDINAMDEMMKKYLAGCDIVYGVRSARATDTFFKRFTAEAFYRVMEKLGANTVFNHADYRLMSKRALDGLAEFKEVNLFLRGIVPMIGYPNDIVTYERAERFAGESKYPLSKMLAFAFEGITSLSVKLIRFITVGGALMIFIAAIVFFYTLYSYFAGFARPGWSSMMISMWFIGGMIMISLGIVGEYVGKIYLESKERPRFIVEKFLNEEKSEK